MQLVNREKVICKILRPGNIVIENLQITKLNIKNFGKEVARINQSKIIYPLIEKQTIIVGFRGEYLRNQEVEFFQECALKAEKINCDLKIGKLNLIGDFLVTELQIEYQQNKGFNMQFNLIKA